MTQIFNKKSQTSKRRILRKNAPQAELALWLALRNRKIGGQKFKRQFSIGRYVVDFYCPEFNLVVEVDGNYHLSPETKNYDLDRQEFIESLGINFLRFSDKEVLENMDEVTNKIKLLTSSQPFSFVRRREEYKISLSLRRRG